MPNPLLSAKDTPLPTFTRCGLLAGASGLAANTLASAAGLAPHATQVSAEFTALGGRFEQALATQKATQDKFNDCERLYWAQCPDVSSELTRDGRLGYLLNDEWGYLSARELRAFLRGPVRRGDSTEIRQALAIATSYEAQERRLRRKVGLRAAERANTEAIDAIDELGALILAAPARTLADFAVKAQAVKAWGNPEWWSGDESCADTYERLAAQVLDGCICLSAGEKRALLPAVAHPP